MFLVFISESASHQSAVTVWWIGFFWKRWSN